MIREAIILAGGFGTRLRSAVPELPKCMAPVAGKPFIYYVINYLRSKNIQRFILSLGYKNEVITDYIVDNFAELDVEYSIETEPLGTGGAVRQACTLSTDENLLIVNGDTIFEVDVQQIAAFHESEKADCTLALKTMHNSERYGVVEMDNRNRIISFKEKKWYEKSIINGGVYALNRSSFMKENLPDKFSFEKDYLEQYFATRKMLGIIQDKYFIDIGIPEDFQKAQLDFKMK